METSQIVEIAATWLPALMIALSGVMKLAGAAQVKDSLGKMGVGQHLPMLGIMEIAFAALFVIPVTMKLGFILCSCYFAGAIATELSHGQLKANPFIPLVLVWIGAYARNPAIFF